MTLKTDEYKIFLYLGYESDTLLVLVREAVTLGLIGKDYAWNFGDVDMVGAEFDKVITNAIKGDLRAAVLPLVGCQR